MTAALPTQDRRALRSGIERAHQQAEHHPLMQCLLSSAVTPQLYRDYLAALLPLYESMERRVGQCDDPLCKLFDRPELRRAEAIARDIDWLSRRAPLPPLRTPNVALPTALLSGEPMALAAMAYLRYLGDLAGGRALWRHLAEKLPVLNPGGLCFYEFDLPASQTAGSYLGALRRSLLQILEAEVAMEAFIEAANFGFTWHLSLFDDVWQGGSMNVDSYGQGLSEPHGDE